MTPPAWLKLHDGTLQPGLSSHTLFVVLGGKPQYRLDVRPAGGQFSCDVMQTINGHRYDSGAKLADESAAFNSGLETLRNQLGW